MKKGRFGLLLCVYPVLAFALVILKQPALCAAVLAAVVFLEQDEWAARQTWQAFFLSLPIVLFGTVGPWAASLLPVPFLTRVLGGIATALHAIAYLIALVFSILGILRVLRGQEANVPLLSELAYRIHGQQKPKPVPYYFNPAQQPGVSPYPPQEQPPVQPAPPEDKQP